MLGWLLVRGIFALVLAYVVWRVVRNIGSKPNDTPEQNIPEANKRSNSPAPAPQTLLQCAHCGIAFPEHDGVRVARQVYCSLPHANAHQTSPASD